MTVCWAKAPLPFLHIKQFRASVTVSDRRRDFDVDTNTYVLILYWFIVVDGIIESIVVLKRRKYMTS